MIARCARCQGTFTTDRFGRQKCPHCGSELLLSDPNAPPGSGQGEGAAPPPGAPPTPPGGPQAPPPGAGAPPGGFAPPPAAPPGGGWGPPPGGLPPAGGGWGGPPPPPPELPSPFAERATRGFFASFFETWKLVATQPQEFFRRVRIDQTGTAILFGVLATTVGNAFNALYSWAQMASGLTGLDRMMERMPEAETHFLQLYRDNMPAFLLGSVILAPVMQVVSIYLVSAIIHLLLMLFRGAKRPFDATLTAVAYAGGLNLLMVVPGCGGFIGLVWGLVVLVIGLGEIQRCGSGKAAAAVFAPVILVCLCCCGVFGLSAPAFLKGLGEAARQGKGSVDL